MNTASKTGKPVKYNGIEDRIKAFKKSVGLRKEWEECSRLGLNYEQMAARGVKSYRGFRCVFPYDCDEYLFK